MSGGFFRGTSAEQDNRFSNKDKKLLNKLKVSARALCACAHRKACSPCNDSRPPPRALTLPRSLPSTRTSSRPRSTWTR